mgnify:CR=1 FL=1
MTPRKTLCRIDALLGWRDLKVYEHVTPEVEAVDRPYDTVGDDVWARTVVLSWRCG